MSLPPYELLMRYAAIFFAGLLAAAACMHLAEKTHEDAWMTIGVPALVVLATALLWRATPTNNP